MSSLKMEFADDLVLPVLEGAKTATVRTGHSGIDMNHLVTATTQNGHPFAKLKITRTAELQALEAFDFIKLVGGKHSAVDEQDMVDTLRKHYDGVKPESQVKVFVFERVDTDISADK